jgi:uncharacterized membrane protein
MAVGELLSGLGASKTKALAGKAVASKAAKKVSGRSSGGDSGGPLSGTRGLAAGAGAAALAPIAVKGVSKLIKGDGPDSIAEAPKKLAQGAASKVGSKVGDKVSGKIDEAGGPSGILKDTVKSALPFGGGGGGGPKGGVDGVGKGRRMPVQQSVDIAAPIETVYNQWTQFEEWPLFMHRVTRVTQEDPCTVSFATKIWGKTKEFTAEIETQRPDERIKWRVSEGITHTGLVTFHELGPRLTRIELGLDVQPGSLLEKLARGARHIKRAARADLHRFKAFIEMLEHETGAWRGVIEDGEVVKDHPSGYDSKREYGSAEELVQGNGDDPEKGKRDKGSNGQRKTAQSRSSSGSRQTRARSSQSSSRQSSSSRGSSGGSSSRRSSGGSSSSNGSGSSGRTRSGSSRRSSSSNAQHQGRSRSRASRRS